MSSRFSLPNMAGMEVVDFINLCPQTKGSELFLVKCRLPALKTRIDHCIFLVYNSNLDLFLGFFSLGGLALLVGGCVLLM